MKKNANNVKSPIQKIRNDLNAHRFRNKIDMNAYRDYEKWRDQVLMSQNNCALRCIKEEKINNTDNNNAESARRGATNNVGESEALENRLKHSNDTVLAKAVIADDANCDDESEWSSEK